MKALIVTPGLWIVILAMVAAAGSGMFLARSRKGRLVDAKKKRMPFIAANGLLVLVPCAIALNRWAAAGTFDTTFYIVQAIELIAGATNFAQSSSCNTRSLFQWGMGLKGSPCFQWGISLK